MPAKVERLVCFPIKSVRGVDILQAKIRPEGMQYDRCYMIADSNTSRAATQREYPNLALISVLPSHAGWVLKFPGVNDIGLPYEPNEHVLIAEVTLHGSKFAAVMQDKRFHAWLRQCFGKEFSPMLVGLPASKLRQRKYSEDKTGFIACHDSSPISIIGKATIADIQKTSRSEDPCFGDRFRANIQFSGAKAFVEEGWKRIRIGKVSFTIRKRIPRCKMLDVCQTTGVYDPSEVVKRTVDSYRSGYAGVYALPESSGTIRVGDTIKVLE